MKTLKESVKAKINQNDHEAIDFDRPFIGDSIDVLPTVSPDEILKLMASMECKSYPMDFIPTSLLKSCSDVFSILISRLANLSFEEGHLPGFTRIYQDPSMKILSWMAIGRGKKHTLINTPSRSSSDDQASS